MLVNKIDKNLYYRGTKTFIDHIVCTTHGVEAVKMYIVPTFKFLLKKQIWTHNHNQEMLYAIIVLDFEKKKSVWQMYHKKSKQTTEKKYFKL